MAAKSFLRTVAGRLTEIFGIQTSAGAGNAGDIPSLDDTGRLDISMMPVGVAAEVQTCPASENLSSGNWVNLWSDSGTLKARKADATTAGKEAQGFVLAAVTSGNTATVYLEGNNTALSSLTLGSQYWLDTTAGGQTTTAPTTTGNIQQPLGEALSATVINFIPTAPAHCVVKA